MTFKIHLFPDEYHLPNVGKLTSGELLWIDTQLEYDFERSDTRDFIAAYVFDSDGKLSRHEIVDVGYRAGRDSTVFQRELNELKSRLGPVREEPIQVYPFSVQSNKLEFGLVIRPREEGESEEEYRAYGPFVDALPGHTLMFYPPWEHGQYDT